MHIFVGNLGGQATQEQLQGIFTHFGQTKSVRIVTDPLSGRSRGFAFVEMPDLEQANVAIGKLNNSNLNGQSLSVSEARPRNNDDIFGKRR